MDQPAVRPRISPRPAVTISYAQTLDGRLATATGNSQWISGPESLLFAHRLRAQHDAVMVGVGTVLKDNPRLTVRMVQGRDPLRVIVDSSLRTPLSAAVLADGAARGTVLAVTGLATPGQCRLAEGLGASVLCLGAGPEGGVDLEALLAALYDLGVRSVLVEGGATLITSLLRSRVVDRLTVCIAPKIIGRGIEAVGDLEVVDLGAALSLADLQLTRLGADVIMDGRVVYPGSISEP